MTTANQGGAPSGATEGAVSSTLLLLCPVCTSDEAEPFGVVGSFGQSGAASVALKCTACTAVYLNPPPPASLAPEPLALPSRRLRRWTQGLPSTAKVLAVDCAGGSHIRALEHMGGPAWELEGTEQTAGAATAARADGLTVYYGTVEQLDLEPSSYDLVLLPHSLETTPQPVGLLESVRSILRPGGRVVALVSNLDSPSYDNFGGRHWSGYQFPRHRQYFSPAALHRLSRSVGFEVRTIATLANPDVWQSSVASLFNDWAAPGWLTGVVSGRWLMPKLLYSVIEGFWLTAGRGSLLAAALEKP